MVSKKLALGATLSFTMTSIAVLATSISSQTTLVKRANAEDVSYSVTFDSENGALLEDAVSARTVDAVTKAGAGEYPLTLEYLKGTSLEPVSMESISVGISARVSFPLLPVLLLIALPIASSLLVSAIFNHP